jgi:hypothetical protein
MHQSQKENIYNYYYQTDEVGTVPKHRTKKA